MSLKLMTVMDTSSLAYRGLQGLVIPGRRRRRHLRFTHIFLRRIFVGRRFPFALAGARFWRHVDVVERGGLRAIEVEVGIFEPEPDGVGLPRVVDDEPVVVGWWGHGVSGSTIGSRTGSQVELGRRKARA